jgi:hypothetical protein
VDGADLLAWQQKLGASGPNLPSDYYLDGTVGAADLAIWKSQFGQSASSAPVITIPEPNAAFTAALAIALFAPISRFGRRFRRPLKTGSRE